jgi:aspartate/methionine/tyrosine aminotransferase
MMLDRQIKRWIHTHNPGWDADPHEFQDLGSERYAIVYITSPNNPGAARLLSRAETPGRRDRREIRLLRPAFLR